MHNIHHHLEATTRTRILLERRHTSDIAMRRVQSLRHHTRPSLATMTDDLGVLREEESAEDALRRELLAKDRENDKVRL